jgi:hypothetical protein
MESSPTHHKTVDFGNLMESSLTHHRAVGSWYTNRIDSDSPQDYRPMDRVWRTMRMQTACTLAEMSPAQSIGARLTLKL